MIDRDLLLQMLRESVITVNFTKVNGESRTMICTLRDDVLPEQIDLEEVVQQKTRSSEAVVVWDTIVGGWRSFRLDSIIDINGKVY